VANLSDFASVDASLRTVPALVYGSMPAAVRTGALLAVAVNGRIGAVVPVLAERPDVPRFAAMVADPSLFTPGANRLELFLVHPQPASQPQLQRVAIA
jgi:hypothetical protein